MCPGFGRGVGFKSYFGPSKSFGEVNRRREIAEMVTIKMREVRNKWIQEERESLLQQVRESSQKEQEK